MILFTRADLDRLPIDLQNVAIEGIKLLNMSGLVPLTVAAHITNLSEGIAVGDDTDSIARDILTLRKERDLLMSLVNLTK